MGTRHALEMVFRLDSDRMMNPATLLYLHRGQVAAAITDQIVYSLEQRYEGKTHSDVASHVATMNDQVTGYQAREYTPKVPQISPSS